MRHSYFRTAIIVIIKTTLLALVLLLLTSQLIQFSTTLNQTQVFLQSHQLSFSLGHALFYLLVYMLWPKLIQIISHRNPEISPTQIKLALSARWYLLITLFFIEALVWWR